MCYFKKQTDEIYNEKYLKNVNFNKLNSELWNRVITINDIVDKININNSINNYWDDLLTNEKNDIKNQKCICNIDNYPKEYILCNLYPVHSFNNGNYIIINPKSRIDTIFDAIKYISDNHKCGNSAFVIKLEKNRYIIGGNIPNYKIHRSDSCGNLSNLSI